MLKKILKFLILNFFWHVMGRRNLVIFSRFLLDGARLDIDNNMETNGEISVQKIVISNAENPTCVFDVGANMGLWTRSFVEIAKKHGVLPTVHAFEPCLSTHRMLTDNLDQWAIKNHVVAQNTGLSSSVGRRSFYSVGSGCGINGFYPASLHENQAVEDVHTDTIDNYCNANTITHIDIIKIDTEGHDMEVLLGANTMLSANAVDVVQFEYNHRWIDARHFLKDAFEYLLPLGYSIGKVTSKGIEFYSDWHYELESFKEANCIAVISKLKPVFPKIKWWNE